MLLSLLQSSIKDMICLFNIYLEFLSLIKLYMIYKLLVKVRSTRDQLQNQYVFLSLVVIF